MQQPHCLLNFCVGIFFLLILLYLAELTFMSEANGLSFNSG